ncbi:MAG: kynureninase [Woeseiaceae bacterium]
MEFRDDRGFAQDLDRLDPLAAFREEFTIPDERDGRSCVYLCGNSLGLQPRLAARYVREELDDWAALGVDGHFHARRPWLPYHRRAAGGLASLTGSLPAEVVAMNALTVNLHLLMTSFYRPDAKRFRILIESTAFPSDRYAVRSQLALHGRDPGADLIEWPARSGDGALDLRDLEELLARHGDSIALLLLPGVEYYNGQVLDMAALCAMARDCGAKLGLDLAHAVGNLPLELHDWGPDFAVWCSYKYLNAGPGAIGGAFVHARHHGRPVDHPGAATLLGWWGHDESTRFEMRRAFTPAAGAELWQLSNPPILSCAPLLASLEIFARAGTAALQEKSRSLTGYLAFLLEHRFHDRIRSITPADARGCQLSLQIVDESIDARRLCRSLKALNVIADWREPDVIRVAPVPLYNRYQDVYDFAGRLGQAMDHCRSGRRSGFSRDPT